MSSDIMMPHLVQLAAANGLAGFIAFGARFGGVGVPVDLAADVVDLLPVCLTAGFPLTIVVRSRSKFIPYSRGNGAAIPRVAVQ